jgi:hypothetical protein
MSKPTKAQVDWWVHQLGSDPWDLFADLQDYELPSVHEDPEASKQPWVRDFYAAIRDVDQYLSAYERAQEAIEKLIPKKEDDR